MLKELATSEAIEGHIEKETILEDLKQVLIWPFYTDDDSKKWNVSKDLNEYGIVIDEVEGETFVSPGDGTISVEGDKIVIEFDSLESKGEGSTGTVEILTKKFVEDDFYRINPDIVKGKKMIIEGVNISSLHSNKVARGETIGIAQAQVKIVMQHEDKSIIGKKTGNNVETTDDNVEDYVNPSYTTHTEEMVIKAIEGEKGVATGGVKLSDWFVNSLNDDEYHGYKGDSTNSTGNNYTNNSESTPVNGPLSGKVGDDMDLVYAIVAAEILPTGDVYESAYAVISCIVNRLGVFTNGQNMTSIVKSPGQWETFSSGAYLNYYPKSKLEASNKSIVIKAVDDCISSGIVSHGFNCFYTANTTYQDKIKAKIKRDNQTITNWDMYCRNIGGNFYYKLRNGKCVAEDA